MAPEIAWIYFEFTHRLLRALRKLLFVVIIHSTRYLSSDWPKAYNEFSK